MDKKWGSYMVFKEIKRALGSIEKMDEWGEWDSNEAIKIKDLLLKARDLAAINYIHIRDGLRVNAKSARNLIPYP